ncbi:MAG: glutathione peroxidase [Nocardioides sp.]|uniref:glutathione peroxidase n=1 Tax=Nocardioides sp. TaxID=35761 RepID=UPI003F0DD0C3
MTTFNDFDAPLIDGTARDLSEYAGQVVLVVNTASKCGFTPQYKGLQQLQETYADRGFTVLGFPCNQFASQEPGDSSEIAEFCDLTFGVTFPLFAKIDVNGSDAHPLWTWMKGEKSGVLGSRGIKWNFTKFLIGRDGQVLARYAPKTTPEAIAADIEAALGS